MISSSRIKRDKARLVKEMLRIVESVESPTKPEPEQDVHRLLGSEMPSVRAPFRIELRQLCEVYNHSAACIKTPTGNYYAVTSQANHAATKTAPMVSSQEK